MLGLRCISEEVRAANPLRMLGLRRISEEVRAVNPLSMLGLRCISEETHAANPLIMFGLRQQSFVFNNFPMKNKAPRASQGRQGRIQDKLQGTEQPRSSKSKGFHCF